MKILFKDNKLRRLCEVRSAAEAAIGSQGAAKLRLRLAALEAATRVTDLVGGNPHPLKRDLAGHLALALAGGSRLVLSPGHDPCPTLAAGGTDWSQVTVVRIEFIGNYHD